MMNLMRVLLILLLIVLAILVKKSWFDDDTGPRKLEELQQTLKEMKAENETLTKKNNRLKQTIDGIKHNYDAREELARKYLGLIKKDETFFHVTPKED